MRRKRPPGSAGTPWNEKSVERNLRRLRDIELTLVSKENYFVFQPMLPEVISGTINVVDVGTPLRRMLERTHLHIRDVESIDLEQKTITCSPGFHPHPHLLKYDELVLALGNVTDFRGMPGLPDHAFPFKNLNDALKLRNHVIRALDEAAILPRGNPLRQRLLRFVVAGGGFSGVEVIAELNDFVRAVVRENYPTLDEAELTVRKNDGSKPRGRTLARGHTEGAGRSRKRIRSRDDGAQRCCRRRGRRRRRLVLLNVAGGATARARAGAGPAPEAALERRRACPCCAASPPQPASLCEPRC